MPSDLKTVVISALCLAFLGAGCDAPIQTQTLASQESLKPKMTNTMQITSPAFKQNDELPIQFTCDGADAPPPLEFKDAPSGTISLVLIEEDPDAPSGAFNHWIVFNIPPESKSLADSYGLSGKNSTGRTGYVGACPPSGRHRYIFHLFALDTMLDLKAGASRQEIEQAMSGHVLDKAELLTTYQR